jgi:hypothetical protein
VIVELDIFSGRVNPRWLLDEARAKVVADLQHRLEPSAVSPPEPPGLGYRGFLYDLDRTTWRAWRGSVSAADLVLADPARAVERWLLASLPDQYGELRPRIAAEIES